jgi:glycosyltransferase involved in cell wall biosynthesis
MKPTIWVLNFFAGTDKSGWGERHYYLSRYFIKQGYSVTIFSSSYNHMFSQLPHTPNVFNIQYVDGINYCWVRTPSYQAETWQRFWSMIVFSLRVCFVNKKKLGLQKPDIILVSSMPIFPLISGYILKKINKSRQLIFEVRDLWPLTPIHLGKISACHPMILLIGFIEKFGYRKADIIVSLLPNSAPYINNLSKRPDKLFYIPNGAYTGNEVSERSDLKGEEFNCLYSDKFIVGYTGTIGLANAMEYVIGAAKLLQNNPKIHFVIVGEGYKKEELIKESSGLKNISFIAKVPKSSVRFIIEKFDICIISWRTSPLYEFGVSANKYFDYMQACKPILVAGNNAKDPVSLFDCGIIVKPEDPEEIVRGILKLYSMTEQERKILGENGKRYVEKFHNYEYLAKKYIDLFEPKRENISSNLILKNNNC